MPGLIRAAYAVQLRFKLDKPNPRAHGPLHSKHQQRRVQLKLKQFFRSILYGLPLASERKCEIVLFVPSIVLKALQNQATQCPLIR